MLTILVIVLTAFAPGAFWLWIVYNRDKYHHEPRMLVSRTFILGVAAALPVGLVEAVLYPHQITDGAPISLQTAAYVAFVVAGITEEVGKFLVVRGTVYGSSHFDEPVDGIVYSSAVALGFASMENVLYILRFGVEVMLIRGPISALGHAVFSSFWGYPLALRKTGRIRSSWGVLPGLLAAIVMHGLFDFTLFAGGAISLAFIPLFIGGAIVFFVLIAHALKVSHSTL